MCTTILYPITIAEHKLNAFKIVIAIAHLILNIGWPSFSYLLYV